FIGRLCAPLSAQLLGFGHSLVYSLGVGDLGDPVLAWIISQCLQCPGAVVFQGWVSIWLIDKAASLDSLTPTFFRYTVLGTARPGKNVPTISNSLAEDLFLLLQRRKPFIICHIWRKQSIKEVLLGRVFFQTAHQVRHRDIEVFHVHDWGVENLAAKHLAYRSLLRWRHTLQHLRVHHGQYVALFTQLIGQAGGKEVMGSNTNAHGSLELRAQNIIQQAVVVGIDLVFTQVRRDLPAVYL